MIKSLITSSIMAGLIFSFLITFSTTVRAEENQLVVMGTPWKLVKVDGKAYKEPAGSPPAFIKLLPERQGVIGFTGCNKFGGTYTQDGNKLSLKLTLSTKNSCPATPDQDSVFLGAIGKTEHFKRNGPKLELFSGDKVIAEFKEIEKK